MTTGQDFPGIVSRHVPGAFELLEAGALDEHHPQFDTLPSFPQRGRWFGEQEESVKKRWRDFLQQLQGYRKERTLVGRQEVWLPLRAIAS